MCKTKGKRLYVSSSGTIHEDWEASPISWASFCWDQPYEESLAEAGNKHYVWSSPRHSAVVSNSSGWSEVSVEYRMSEEHDREQE